MHSEESIRHIWNLELVFFRIPKTPVPIYSSPESSHVKLRQTQKGMFRGPISSPDSGHALGYTIWEHDPTSGLYCPTETVYCPNEQD